jgi:hypothetical protein
VRTHPRERYQHTQLRVASVGSVTGPWACVNREHLEWYVPLILPVLLPSPDCSTHACTVSSFLSGEVGSKERDRSPLAGVVLITLCVFAAKPRMARLATVASPSPRVSWAHPNSSGLRADKISNVERLVSALVSAGTRKMPLQLPRARVAWPVAKTLREPCRPKRDNHHQQGVSRLERQLSSLQRHRLTCILRASCAT